jgi:hypothetical protein
MAIQTLELMSDEYAICKLPPHAVVPSWLAPSAFHCVTRTLDELSVLCLAAQVPASVQQAGGWRLLKLQGPFSFTEVGVLAGVLEPLAAARVSILAVSTFHTDYVLVQTEDLTRARDALLAAGYKFTTQESGTEGGSR